MLETVKNTVENTLNISFKNESRQRDIVDARIIFTLISSIKPGTRIKHISHQLNKDHATVIHYKKTALNLIQFNNQFKKKYIKCLLSNGSTEKEITYQTSKEFIQKIIKKRK